ncbi:cyclase family protein [Aeromicrobium sp.]|uniref:cyclase family protein n=1 Tax=Aeromicrobium sp. TaxID=1871063 RepID=UPI0025BC6597|nr:cyclase family protein [Aeromicrobium sp.]MCK5890265.1 cyclase family protein [Aeromicrobium sp.]
MHGQRTLTDPRPQAEADAVFAEVSNWGRWGPDDELGTVNLIDATSVRAGFDAVLTGERIGCGVLELASSISNPAPAQHFMVLAPDTQTADYGICRDFLAFPPHGPGITHIDALCHVFYKGLMYNGRPAADVTSSGAQSHAITAFRDGITTRGVLLDLPRFRGVDFLEPDEPVRSDELSRATEAAGLEIRVGDALVVRVGRRARRDTLGAEAEYLPGSRHLRLAGLDIDCLPWLREQGVSVMISDAGHDALPSPFGPAVSPLHVGCLIYLGMPLVDNAQLDRLAEACASRGRSDFLLTLNPLSIEGCTGSPVNPVAVL